MDQVPGSLSFMSETQLESPAHSFGLNPPWLVGLLESETLAQRSLFQKTQINNIFNLLNFNYSQRVFHFHILFIISIAWQKHIAWNKGVS